MTVSLSCFFAGKKSSASAHLPAPTMFSTKLSFNSEDFQRTRSFLLLKALILQRGPLKQVQREFSSLCQKRETGKLNEKQQLTTLSWDVGSKWTNPKKTKIYTWLKFRIKMNQSNTCCVSWEVLLVSWKTNGALKIHEMGGPLKIKGRSSLVNSWMFSYP